MGSCLSTQDVHALTQPLKQRIKELEQELQRMQQHLEETKQSQTKLRQELVHEVQGQTTEEAKDTIDRVLAAHFEDQVRNVLESTQADAKAVEAILDQIKAEEAARTGPVKVFPSQLPFSGTAECSGIFTFQTPGVWSSSRSATFVVTDQQGQQRAIRIGTDCGSTETMPVRRGERFEVVCRATKINCTGMTFTPI